MTYTGIIAEEARKRQIEKKILPWLDGMRGVLGLAEHHIFIGTDQKFRFILPEKGFQGLVDELGRIGNVFGVDIYAGDVDRPHLAIPTTPSDYRGPPLPDPATTVDGRWLH